MWRNEVNPFSTEYGVGGRGVGQRGRGDSEVGGVGVGGGGGDDSEENAKTLYK